MRIRRLLKSGDLKYRRKFRLFYRGLMRFVFRAASGLFASLLLSAGWVRAAELVGSIDDETRIINVSDLHPSGDCGSGGDCVWPPG